ncbi:hypothetical protein N9857_03985 [Gammaproteobacteria bacterium]|nr:hypothetical protein [Gammaproteobacteria bacterium]
MSQLIDKKKILEAIYDIEELFNPEFHDLVLIHVFDTSVYYKTGSSRRSDYMNSIYQNLYDSSYDIRKHFFGIVDKGEKLDYHSYSIQLTTHLDFFVVDGWYKSGERKIGETASLARKITKAKKGEKVSYIDRNPLNLTKKNLVKVNNSEGFLTKRADKESKSRFIGVSPIKPKLSPTKRWKTEFTTNKNRTYLGAYEFEESAAMAYNIGKLILTKGKPVTLNQVYNIENINSLIRRVKYQLKKGLSLKDAIQSLQLDSLV